MNSARRRAPTPRAPWPRPPRRRTRRARRRCPARYRRRARCSTRTIRAFVRLRIDRRASRRVRRRVSRAREPGSRTAPATVPLRNRSAAHLASPSTAIDRHVVLPPDIAKLLPKGRLLSEVRFRTAIRLDAAALPEPRRYRSSVSRPLRCRSGPVPLALAREFRATPRRHARALREARGGADPRLSLSFSFSQAEWRGLGVQQSRGWVHYAIHRPEPHIMLYRCVSRPVPRALFSNRRGRGSRPILPPHPAAMRRSTRVARVRDDAVASGARIPRRRRTPRRRRRREGRRRGLGAVARKRPKRNTIGARLTNANATLTSSSPGYTQAHAQLRSARVVGCGQQGERAVSAGRGAWRRALWGTRAFERRRSATIGRDAPERRRRAKLDFEEGG